MENGVSKTGRACEHVTFLDK